MKNSFTRRGLLGLGLGAAALPALARGSTASPLSSAAGVGFAVVGLGKLSLGQILPGFANCRTARLVGLVSGHADKANRLAAEHKLPTESVYSYADFDRVAADPRIEVVYIVLPNFMHAEYTIRALKAGKHVLCEKPMATTIGDAERMITAAKQANRKLMIAYRCHYEPLNLYGMRLMRRRALGTPRLVVTNMSRQSDLSDPSDAWRLDQHKSGGGALTDMGIYGINAARYLLGEEPVEVRAHAQTDRRDARFRTVEDLVTWKFGFPSGAISTGSTSFNQAATMSWDVYGEKGKISADPGCFYGGNHLAVSGVPDEGHVKIQEIDQFAREMDWMAEVVRGRAPMVSPGEEGLQDMRLMHAIMESASRGGATVKTAFGYRRSVDPAMVTQA